MADFSHSLLKQPAPARAVAQRRPGPQPRVSFILYSLSGALTLDYSGVNGESTLTLEVNLAPGAPWDPASTLDKPFPSYSLHIFGC